MGPRVSLIPDSSGSGTSLWLWSRLFQLRFGDGQCTSTATAWGGPSNANGGNAVVAACAGEKYSDAAEADAKGVRFWMAEREE